MPAGRPTKYNKNMLQTAYDYYNTALDDEAMFPSVDDLSLRLGIDDDTVVEWAKVKPEFSAAVKRIKALQKLRLQASGLTNKVNPTMAIFLLKVNHGLIETSRNEHTGAEGGPIETNTLTYMPKQLKADYFEQPSTTSG